MDRLMGLDYSEKVLEATLKFIDDESFYGGPSPSNTVSLMMQLKEVTKAATAFRDEASRLRDEKLSCEARLAMANDQLREIGLVA